MGAITVTASTVKIMNENEVVKIRGACGATVTPGQPVYLDGTSGWKPADADAAASGMARGIAVSDAYGSTSFVSGTAIDIVVYGRVGGLASMTPGGNVYVSLDAGNLDQTAPPNSGDFIFAVGWAESATVLFVQPQITVPTANAS